ncbi:MAG: YjbQ family protein [Candidatus Abyssobacteria bacterium SURF_17]|uniref:YjbQ family protein n=1 Tax=Candidatus Abyssobacteria bacterium SURF_17 TaxID=2093361 RepID=A0A419ETP5_9BACT|nr:MAG: YjbQ family protein [Candidatus Abyssubacteria bacterium SURF_17]
MLERISLSTKSREEFVDITNSVQQIVTKAKTREGICIVYVPHTTAGLTVNENADPSVKADILMMLSRLIPRDDPKYGHSEGNSDGHIKSTLVGFSHVIPISDAKLTLGTWQGIFFCEFDGPRKRSVLVQVLSEKA